MENKKVAMWCLYGGLIILAAASILRVGALTGLIMFGIHDLWKLSMGLLVASIAASLSKS